MQLFVKFKKILLGGVQSHLKFSKINGPQNLFPEGPVIKCFVIPPNSKIEKKMGKNYLLDAYGGCATVKPSYATETTR